jgi:hypothetical protein
MRLLGVLPLLLVPDQAPPVAFVAGALGPLIGADLLHLRDIEKIATGIASIGAPGPSTGSCRRGSSRRIWRERGAAVQIETVPDVSSLLCNSTETLVSSGLPC